MKLRTLFGKLFVLVLTGFLLSLLVQPAPAQTNPRQPQEEKLLNGLKVLMWPDTTAKNVAVRIRVHSGAAFDPQGREGVRKMLAENIFPNTSARDFFTEDLGGSLEIITTYDYIQINASSKPASFLTMLETLASAISNPVIDKENTTKVRDALLAKLKDLEANPAYIADRAVAKRLFGTFPYGRPEVGTSETVLKIDFVNLLDAKDRFLTADNATLAITGNFDKSLAFKAVRRYFGSWLKSDKKVPPTFRQPDEPDWDIVNITEPNAVRNEIRFALRGVARNDKDYVAASVFTIILRERFRSTYELAKFEDVSISNNANALPGFIILRGSGKKAGVPGFRTHQESPSAPDYVNNNRILTIFAKVTEREFANAYQEFLAEDAKKIMNDRWLDADTYKIVPADDAKAVETVTLADVQRIANRLAKNPVVTVVVWNGKS